MVVGKWNEHVHVAQVVFVVQTMVLFNEAEPPEALHIMSLGYVHQVVGVLIAREVCYAGRQSAPHRMVDQEVIDQPEEWSVESDHRWERVPAKRNVRWPAGTCCFEFSVPVVKLMVDYRVAAERVVEWKMLFVHNIAVHEPFKIAAINEPENK